MAVATERAPMASRRRGRVDSARKALVTYPRMSYIVVVTTVGNEEQANLIAEEVVARRHAGCVNIIPGIRSLYRWQGKICRDSEYMLLIKTLDTEYEALAQTLLELHSYELPEVLAFGIQRGEQNFLDWIAGCLDKHAEFSDEPEVPVDDTSY